MKTIRHHSTLFYYDGPQVFEARDAIGGHYVAVMIDSGVLDAADAGISGTVDRYFIAGVAPEQLRLFRLGSLELRSLLVDSDEDERYLATADAGIDQPMQLQRLTKPLDCALIPEPGFFLHDKPADEHVLREARERNNLIIEIAAEPAEATSQHRVRAHILAGLLNRVQFLVKYAYRATIVAPSRLVNGDLLDVVVPEVGGPYQVVLEASSTPDAFGGTELGRALPRVDRLLEDVANPQATLAVVTENRGHLVGAYVMLLRFLVACRTGLRYSWAEPKSEHPSSRSVSYTEAGPLVDALLSVETLARETVTLEGVFERFNAGSGAWRLLTDEGHRSGKIAKDYPSLDGLKVGRRYRFYCDEQIKEIDVTGKEYRTLHLNRHEPA